MLSQNSLASPLLSSLLCSRPDQSQGNARGRAAARMLAISGLSGEGGVSHAAGAKDPRRGTGRRMIASAKPRAKIRQMRDTAAHFFGGLHADTIHRRALSPSPPSLSFVCNAPGLCQFSLCRDDGCPIRRALWLLPPCLRVTGAATHERLARLVRPRLRSVLCPTRDRTRAQSAGEKALRPRPRSSSPHAESRSPAESRPPDASEDRPWHQASPCSLDTSSSHSRTTA